MSDLITMREALRRDIDDLKRERDEALEQLRLANIDCFAALTELDAAQKYADAAMFERDQLRMRVAELQNGIVVEAAK